MSRIVTKIVRWEVPSDEIIREGRLLLEGRDLEALLKWINTYLPGLDRQRFKELQWDDGPALYALYYGLIRGYYRAKNTSTLWDYLKAENLENTVSRETF